MKVLLTLLVVFLNLCTKAQNELNFDYYLEANKLIDDTTTLMYAHENWGRSNMDGGDNWFGAYFKVNSWFTFNPLMGYGINLSNPHRYEAFMPGMHLIFHAPLGDGWKLKFKTRQAYFDVKDVDRPFYQTRNTLTLISPYKWTEYNITPSATLLESFFTTRQGWSGFDRFNKFRSYVMLSGEVRENLIVTIWYLRQWTRFGPKVGGFRYTQQVGAALLYVF